MELVRCVCVPSVHPVLPSTKRLTSSYVAHCAAVRIADLWGGGGCCGQQQGSSVCAFMPAMSCVSVRHTGLISNQGDHCFFSHCRKVISEQLA